MLLKQPSYLKSSWGEGLEEVYEWLQCKIAQNCDIPSHSEAEEQYLIEKERTYHKIIKRLWENPKIKNWVKNNLWTTDH